MRRTGRDRRQLLGVTLLGAVGLLVMLLLLSPEAPAPPTGASRLAGPAAWVTTLATAPAGEGGASAVGPSSSVPPEASAGAGESVAPSGERAPLRLVGRVEDPDGRPVPGAVILLRRPPAGTPQPISCTDPQGRFEVGLGQGHEPGVCQVCAEAPPWAPSAWLGLELRRGEERVLEAPLRLAPSGHLRGRVRDAQGGAVAGAEVRVTADRQSRTTRTDAAGRFELPVGEGLCEVRAVSPGFVPGVARDVPVAVATGGVVELVLTASAAIEGVVLDSGGRPVGEARVSGVWEGRSRHRVETDARGRLRLDALPPGRWELLAHDRDERGCARQALDLQPGQVAEVALRLGSWARVVGRFTDRRGEPVPWLEVLASVESGDEGHPRGEVLRTGECDEAGRFAIERLNPGRYRLWVQALRGPPLAEARVEVAAGETRACDLRLPASGRIEGVLLGPDDRPRAGGAVLAFQGETDVVGDRSDAQGAFCLDRVPPGEYRLRARQGDDLVALGPPLELAEGQSRDGVRLRLRVGGRLRGQVLDAAGRPVAGLGLEARGVGHPGGATATTDGEGRFETRALHDGRYELGADPGGLALEARRRGAAGARLGPLPLEVREGGDLTLELRLETR